MKERLGEACGFGFAVDVETMHGQGQIVAVMFTRVLKP
jgi:hypothetical protein